MLTEHQRRTWPVPAQQPTTCLHPGACISARVTSSRRARLLRDWPVPTGQHWPWPDRSGIASEVEHAGAVSGTCAGSQLKV